VLCTKDDFSRGSKCAPRAGVLLQCEVNRVDHSRLPDRMIPRGSRRTIIEGQAPLLSGLALTHVSVDS
jgi:hypothetical protein